MNILPFLRFKKGNNIQPVVLVVLDGFGIAPHSEGNAITLAKTPRYKELLDNYPNTKLIASGESVGLPANEVGNTEVGHLTIGAGRVIYQDLKRIDMSIEKGLFFNNRAFLQATAHLKSNNSKLHIMGLVGSGGVHSSIDHLFALLRFCKKEEVENVFLHLFTDGRDSPPKEGIEIVKKVEDYLTSNKVGKIASICGRYYAMDRDRRWDRTEKAYKAIVSGVGQNFISASDALTGAYSKNQTDEFVEPSVITQNGKPVASVDDNDAVIFYNFRNDRSKQLSMAFVLKDFENLKLFDFGYDPEASKEVGQVKMSGTFNREKISKNIFFVSMTEYQKNLPVSAIAFGPEVIKESLGEIIARSGLAQAHISESEKERFVKYYFNGMKEEPMDKEDDIIVPSPKIATYDKKPEMSLPKLIKEFLRALNKDIYSFFLINFANSDMVGHTGNLPATIKAIEYVDKYLGILVDRVLGVNGTIFITADHGNAEELLTFPSTTFFFTSSSGSVNTDHSNNPVPFIAVNKKLRGIKKTFSEGGLSDVAPTILGFMGIEISPLMTGKNIFDQKNELNKPLPVQEEVKSN